MSGRALTDGEVRMARAVFGDSVEYDHVRIHAKRLPLIHDRDSGVSHKGRIYTHGEKDSADFSKEPDANKRCFFIHEMTHVWQYQNRVVNLPLAGAKEMLKTRFNYEAAYPYRLERGRDLTAYGFEQQAAIVQDYFLLKHCGCDHSYKDRLQNAGLSRDEKLNLYESVLKNFIENPGYAGRNRFKKTNGKLGPASP